MTRRFPAFFGYGSLVNRATHDHAPAEPARLSGWRRVWRQTSFRQTAFLSVEPAEGMIAGLVAAVPDGDWGALDRREAAYRRHPVAAPALGTPPGWASAVEVYVVDPAHHGTSTDQSILLSYLDVVVQGFLREFGETGVTDFFATTKGWTTILDDRANPVYPRHQMLTAAERALTDSHLDALGVPRTRA